jgi:hypothetical protein
MCRRPQGLYKTTEPNREHGERVPFEESVGLNINNFPPCPLNKVWRARGKCGLGELRVEDFGTRSRSAGRRTGFFYPGLGPRDTASHHQVVCDLRVASAKYR